MKKKNNTWPYKYVLYLKDTLILPFERIYICKDFSKVGNYNTIESNFIYLRQKLILFRPYIVFQNIELIIILFFCFSKCVNYWSAYF